MHTRPANEHELEPRTQDDGSPASTITPTRQNTGQRTGGDGVVAISRVSIAFTMGSCLGPLVAGFAIDAMPAVALPGMTVIGCLGLLQRSRARRLASI